MSRTLDVYLHQIRVGTLTQTRGGQMSFQYAEDWLANKEATPLSISLPLQFESFNQKRCQPYFAGLLPEERARTLIAQKFRISANNDFALLEKIGGECAGAVSLLPQGEAPPDSDYSYQELSENELIAELETLPKNPLLAGKSRVRLSLAGAQFKMAVKFENGKFSIPLNGAPSTHIVKIGNPDFEYLIENEAICSRLAGLMQIGSVEASIYKMRAIKFLLVKRFDRTGSRDSNGKIEHHRLHQEDFCQALGILPQNKYQREGGPSFADSFKLLIEHSSSPIIAISRLLNSLLFNYFIGNNDAHGKNFSLIYANRKIELAPFYDLVCTLFYDGLSTEMAMRIGTEYDSNRVSLKNFEELAVSVGMSARMIRDEIGRYSKMLSAQIDGLGRVGKIEQQILEIADSRCKSMLEQLH